MPTRQNALFARAFYSAFKATCPRAPYQPRRTLSSSLPASTGKKDNAPSPDPAPSSANPLRLSDVTENLLNDFEAPLASEPLEVGRKTKVPKGFFSISGQGKKFTEDMDDIEIGRSLLDKLRQRASERRKREAHVQQHVPAATALARESDPLEALRDVYTIEREDFGMRPPAQREARDQRSASSFYDDDAPLAPIVSQQWGADKFYQSGWGKDALRSRPRDLLDDEDVPINVATEPVVLRSGVIEPVTVSKVHTIDPGIVQPPIARLAHGLDRVLFNPGVHWMRDPHSGVYNFAPYLQRLPDVREFDFGRLHPYMRSSRDTTLGGLARKYGKMFAGSSSSLTGIMSHVYRLISGEKPVDTSTLSAAFDAELANFSGSLTMPVTVRLNNKDGVWMVDPEMSSPEEDEKHILLWMGTMLEKFLTRTPEEFMTLLRTSPPPTEPPPREAYQYSQSNKFLLRGQLDCVDPRLPGTGVFDIKTRATMLVRYDRWNMEDFAGYELTKQHGYMESFEREQYDLIRSAFLKYAFQARIGNMDGCIVAYHNTVKHMGFEYYHNDAMEKLVYGKSGVGLRIFHQCMDLLEHILEASLKIFPGQDIELLFDKFERSDRLSVFVIPLEAEPVDVQLISVSTRSLLGDVVVDKPKAILSLRDDWSVKYSIARLTYTQDHVRRLYDASLARQQSAFPRAPGMSSAEMVTMWRDFSTFGREHATPNLDATGDVPMKFFPPTAKIASLRKIARRGHVRIEEQAKKDKGKEEVVHLTEPSSFKRLEAHDNARITVHSSPVSAVEDLKVSS